MKKLLIILTMLMAATVNNNAQNIVVDQLDTPHYTTFYDSDKGGVKKITVRDKDTVKVDYILPYFNLDPNKTIIENYKTIDSIGQLYARDSYEYTLRFSGFYHNNNGNEYTAYLGEITNGIETSIGGQIIELLTNLYSKSLDEPFKTDEKDMLHIIVNEKTMLTKSPTGIEYKHQNGNVTKEYKQHATTVGGNVLYELNPGTEPHKKIYYKVMEETGLIEDTDHPTKTASLYVARNKYEIWKYKDELKKKLRQYRRE